MKNKSVLISIQPKWCELILRGEKTIEVRKTKPKLELPFKCYIYQSKGRDRLIEIIKDGDLNYGEIYHGKAVFIKTRENSGYEGLFGREQKVIGEFVCDEINEIRVFDNGNVQDFTFNNLGNTCLSYDEIAEYIGRNRVGYSWHISDLKIYDKPKELSEFATKCNKNCETGCNDCEYYHFEAFESAMGVMECCRVDGLKPITRPPQSWCYVEEREENA